MTSEAGSTLPLRVETVPIYDTEGSVLWGVASLVGELGLFAIGQNPTPRHDDVKCQGAFRWDATELHYRLHGDPSGLSLPFGMAYIIDINIKDGTMTVVVLRTGDILPKMDFNHDHWSSLEQMKAAHHRYWTLAQMRDISARNKQFLLFVERASKFNSAADYLKYTTSEQGTEDLKKLSRFNHSYVGPMYESCLPHNKKITTSSWIVDGQRVRILAVDKDDTVYVTVGMVWKGSYQNIIPAPFLFAVTRKVILARRFTKNLSWNNRYDWDRDTLFFQS